jgi:hypothetical protein
MLLDTSSTRPTATRSRAGWTSPSPFVPVSNSAHASFVFLLTALSSLLYLPTCLVVSHAPITYTLCSFTQILLAFLTTSPPLIVFPPFVKSPAGRISRPTSPPTKAETFSLSLLPPSTTAQRCNHQQHILIFLYQDTSE